MHGGERFSAPTVIDDEVAGALDELTALAPLHQPKSLAALAAVRAARPGLPEVACFDTAFHAGLPAAASTYALPAAWRERWPLRRYGFHGLSHAWASRRAGAGRVVDLPPRRRAPRWPRCATGAASTPRWASRRSRDW